MKIMSNTQKRSAVTLIRSECCNYFSGECVALDCVCPQEGSYSLICKWFREAVLPLDKELHAQIMGGDGVKTCAVCGREFRAVSNRAKYCAICAAKAHKTQKAACERRRRQNKG